MGFEGNLDQESATPPKQSFFRYNSPLVQVSIIGLVCFCCPGMYWVDPTAVNNANTALYATFAIFGILYYNHCHQQTFAIIAGAILGIGVGFLWAGQGTIMTSYPLHNQKGTNISLYFQKSWSTTVAVSVTNATYIGFMCFMIVGALLSLAILLLSKVICNDGTSCTNIEYSSKMLLIVLAAWASNFFFSYQFINVNGALFNLRTRGLNNVVYWVAQILGSIGIGYVLDFSFPSQKMRGYVGIAIVALLGTVIWAGGLASQLKYSRHDLPKNYGLLDAMLQTLVYWFIGCLADDSETLSRYTGFYKGVHSAGAVVAWQIDTCKVLFLSELIVNWSLMTMGYPLLVVLVKLAVKEDEDGEEGAKKAVASSFAH
ncbi:hypothetical protein ACJRO7_006682 [Eucalyptus globulus]|uniref:DUF895 domain membrane protein n=1 Tax=Eucalyptus globulus TaxID=34317 RepID=A0ABD3IIR7_EUCGL